MTRQFIFNVFLSLLLLGICQSLYASQNQVEIQIEGVKGELLDNVLAYLSLEQQKNHPRLSASRIKRLHKQAPEEIKKALQPFGYYRADITTAELIPLSSNDDEAVWQAKYVIKLGEPLKITKVLLGGSAKDEKVFQKQFDEFPIKVGDTLNQPNYEKAKRVLRNLAEEYGYFDAKFTKHEIRIDEQAYAAEILLDFESNRRYIFGPVIFNQEQYSFNQEQFSFNESLLRRFLTFKSGDYYIGSRLLNFKNALSNSDYFQEVDVDIAHASPTGDLHLPVNVTLKRRKQDKYAAGIGYGTDTGARGSLSFQRRYINRYGHQFSAKTELSEIRRSATARYFIPMGLHPDSFLTITAGYKDESTDTSESEVFLVGISKNHTRRFFDKPLSEVIGIEYRDEKYAIGSDTGHAKLLMPNINWSYVDADNRIYTLNGYKIQLDVRGALNDVGSNTSFLQTRLNTTFIHQLLEDGRIIARGDVGYSAISLLSGDFHDLPPSIRFFAGGDRSVRGYDYQTLGPKNLEGQVIGGKNLLVGSIEYDHKILEKWSLAIFYDVGNAFNGFSEPLKQGAGVGVRWHSPVGLIRVDVATALSEEGRPWRLHITIGPDL